MRRVPRATWGKWTHDHFRIREMMQTNAHEYFGYPKCVGPLEKPAYVLCVRILVCGAVMYILVLNILSNKTFLLKKLEDPKFITACVDLKNYPADFHSPCLLFVWRLSGHESDVSWTATASIINELAQV
jgi:hypothetical protein